MDAITPKVETRLLPALAAAIAEWFPELGGRSMAVSESAVTKENVPTLPLVVVAFTRSTGEQNLRARQSQFNVEDYFVVEFWLKPERYQRSNGTESPFWSYYNYEAIRDKLLTHMATWEAPRNARIAYRTMNMEADPLAVTITLGFIASINWQACVNTPPDMIIKDIPFHLCIADQSCAVDECFEPAPCEDPCK